MSTTTDPNDPNLKRGIDSEPVEQNKAYLVLSPEEIAKGFVRPVRRSYIHQSCGNVTRMAQEIAETYARNPKFYGVTYCCVCKKHLAVWEFRWLDDNQVVGS